MNKLIIICLFFIQSASAQSLLHFKDNYNMSYIVNSYRFAKDTGAIEFTINTALGTGTADFTIPCNSVGTYNCIVDWGDSSQSTITAYNDADLAHTYSSGGVYTIRITGSFGSFYFNNTGDYLKVTELLQLGGDDFYIGDYSFYGCSNITGDLTIPSTVTSLGIACFRDCAFDGSLTLSDNLITIGTSAIRGCSFTGDLTIPNTVTSIGIYAFESAGFTGTLTISDLITTIPTYAFAYCGFIGTLTIPENITAIKEGAFYGCSFTGALTLPSGLVTLGVSAFRDNTGFTGDLTIPEGVTSIQATCFRNTGFTGTLTIPEGVTSIGISALRDIAGITIVNCYPAAAPTVGVSGLLLGGTARELHVPTTNTGYNVTPWTDTAIFSTIIADL